MWAQLDPRLRGGFPSHQVFGMAYMSSGYGVPLAAQDYTWCWGSNMEPCWTSCRFAVRPSSKPGPLERARCAHSVTLLHLTATWVSLSDLSALALYCQDHCSKVSMLWSWKKESNFGSLHNSTESVQKVAWYSPNNWQGHCSVFPFSIQGHPLIWKG